MKEKEDFYSKAGKIFEENGLSEYLCDEILEKFYLLTEIMLETNKKMNITAITDIPAVIARHYADSLLMLKVGIERGARICDIGCGGGFPSFPIAIARPDLFVTGIDSTAKKVAYVNDTAKRLGLKNLSAISGRAEELASASGEMRESFDVVTARAVASLPVLSELCLPFVKVGGLFVALKAKTGEEELDAAKEGIKKLGGRIEGSEKLILRDETLEKEGGAERLLVTVRKIAPTTEKYPRAFGQIKKKPL
ncbi:MAG: 16S rRNA (guanine(527)-N(7))-methyltransferase RsmG [Clostridia bacterium]|nr:16S rRNA (guanine(527)-N(7))-methyltransferase RsmG [Clostridia bacterium]